MTTEQIGALFTWGKSIVDGAKSQGFPMQELSASGQLKDFVAWAKACDSAVRQFGASPPALPQA